MKKIFFLLSLVPGLALGAAGDIPVEQADGTFTTQTIGGDASLAADGALTVSGGSADTAGALAANGANCSPGNSPLGVDTAGASENCFDVWTEAENTAAGYLSAETDPVWALSPSYGITADQVTHWDTAYGWGAPPVTSVAGRTGEITLSLGDVSGITPAAIGAATSAQGSLADSALQTETDPVWALSPSYGITATQVTHWDTAYGWGDHASAGYLDAADIGVSVQAYDADLTTWAGLTPSANAQSFVTAANYAAMQGLLSVDDLITLSGVAEGSTNLGTFTGSTIPDNQTTKQALQALESVVDTAVQTETDPVFSAAQAANITAQNITDLGNLSGTNSGDQTITLTGDVTGSGTGSFAATIADSVTVTGWELGSATATTPSADDNDTSVATTAYVQGEINGAGGTNLSCASGSCDVTPAGSDTEIQYNNSGALGAASTFTYNDSTYTFKLGYDGSNYCTWVSAADGALNLSCLGTDADFNIDLTGATDGDFSVNTNDLFVDTSTGAVGINTTSPDSSSKLDVYGKIYQNGVQSLYNPSTFTGTIVVGDGGGSLSHTSGSEGYYNTFVGIGAGGDATTQSRVTAGGYLSAAGNTGTTVTANGAYSARNNTGSAVTTNGYSSAYNNTGDYVTATGRDSTYFNTGNYVTATGAYSARNNTGNTVTANGYASAQNNTGNYVTANGYASAQNNTGTDVSANGAYSAKYNTGTNVVANGADSVQYNSKDNVTALGYEAYNTWVNGSSYAISSADAEADTVTVTGHGITIGTYKPLKVSGAGVEGLINGGVYTFKAVDANTLQPLGGNITSDGTATLYDNANDFTNVTALGYNAEPTKDNQVMLGDTNVIEVKTYAEMLDLGGAITARELGSDPADPDEGSHVCWQSDGTGTGDDGDIICKITAGGTTKTTTLIDFSAL